jgi:hypothetical protein
MIVCVSNCLYSISTLNGTAQISFMLEKNLFVSIFATAARNQNSKIKKLKKRAEILYYYSKFKIT